MSESRRQSRAARQKAMIAAGSGLISQIPRSKESTTARSGLISRVLGGRVTSAVGHPSSITRGGNACAAVTVASRFRGSGNSGQRLFGLCRSTCQKAQPGA